MRQPISILPNLYTYCRKLEENFNSIKEERKRKLDELSTIISNKLETEKSVNIITICTHNSRRSQIGQIWIAICSDYYNIPNINSYSGGTEVTTFNTSAVAALKRIGIQIDTADDSTNPTYDVHWKKDMQPLKTYSKKYDSDEHPSNFIAIMVCDDAYAKCPIVYGADQVISLSYEDPKKYDNSELESLKYDEKVKEIGTEILYLFSNVKL